MRKFAAILITAAALTAGIGVSLAAIAVTKNSPVAEAVKAPISPLDSCACGGSGNVQIGCFSYWNGSAWSGYIQYRRYDGFVWSSWMTSNSNFC